MSAKTANPKTAGECRRVFERPHWGRLLLGTALLLAIGVALRIGVPIYKRRVAIREIKRLNGSVQYIRERAPGWLFARIDDEGMEWFADPDHVVFWANESNMARRSRYGGVLMNESGPSIDDAGLVCVRGLPNLKSLDVAFSSVSDAGLKQVGGLRALENFRLTGTDVSDLCIPILCQMRGLKTLDVVDTQISNSGCRELEAALPGCEVRGAHNDPWALGIFDNH